MRKRIALLLALMACLGGLAACGTGSGGSNSPAASAPAGY
jgi:hypothetical protein